VREWAQLLFAASHAALGPAVRNVAPAGLTCAGAVTRDSSGPRVGGRGVEVESGR